MSETDKNPSPGRAGIPARYRWDLRHIFRDAAALKAGAREITSAADRLAAMKGKAASDPLAAAEAYFRLDRLLSEYYTYSHMQKDQDAGRDAYKVQMARADALLRKAREAFAFLRPELLTLPESRLRALAQDVIHPQYSVFFEDLLREKPHVLPLPQEELLAKCSEVFGTAHKTYSVLNAVDLPLPEVLGEDGQKVRMTHANYGPLIRSADRAVRKAAFLGMMKAYGGFANTLSSLYVGAVKNDVLQARLRGYPSAREASLFPNRIPVNVYDNLVKEAARALPALDRYLALRRRALKVDALHLYDLYPPISRDFSMALPYPEAFRLVKKGLAPLGPEYGECLARAYRERWVDVYETPGKTPGAYSTSTYGSHPYVLLNHTDTLDGAMTLAHELGHAMHSLFSDREQPYEKAGYSLFAAEVASTCNEVLLNQALTREYDKNKDAKLFFLTSLAEHFRTTFFRQTLFAEFEMESHRLEEAGEVLTEKRLSDLHLSLNTKYYGRECVINPEIQHEWLRIPHFYRAFYVYQYATGFSAAVFLADRIQKGGAPALSDYFRFLKSGGSLPPIEALRLAGADMEKPGVIRGAMKVFSDLVAQMEELVP